MSQQYPQQPGWGTPQQPGYGYPQQPGWGPPPPQPPKRKTGKILGIIGAVFAGLIVIGAIANSGGKGSSNDASSDPSSSPAAVEKDDAAASAAEENPEPEPAPEAPVKIIATETTFARSILAQDGDYTSVKVMVTNNSDETISVNPLYFGITDTDGTKHSAELAVDENQIDTVKLAPGENVSGSITGKGKFTPKAVTYTDGFLSEPIRVDVS
ncbi:hypothetical protein QR97_16770 [Streptomyces sp. PBH53]|uniref:DUF4352 domain-containing protein n=1 Tax=Streptomyces sp. PBH53 TaxID=1577075 RepID=UPI00065663BE|nr:DUF4352 domain-containing protein [Streptomyces sp. PBH53]AKN71237.1 hypothetical protein QR97_16770 [Streptomyces sp. PBH53]